MLTKVFRLEKNEVMPDEVESRHKDLFIQEAKLIYERHLQQTEEEVKRLNLKYKTHRIGSKPMFDHLQSLSSVVDPSDPMLGCLSQLTHVLQVAEAMRVDGFSNDWLVLALVHDLGKLLLLENEAPENVVGPNSVISGSIGEGLDQSVFTWGHDEWAYQRLAQYLSEEMAWVLRCHSLRFDQCLDYLSDTDKRRYDELLLIFRSYDLSTKSMYFKPKWQLEDYRDLLEAYFSGNVLL